MRLFIISLVVVLHFACVVQCIEPVSVGVASTIAGKCKIYDHEDRQCDALPSHEMEPCFEYTGNIHIVLVLVLNMKESCFFMDLFIFSVFNCK